MLSPIGLTAALVIAALCGPSDPPSTPPAKSTPSTSPAAGDPIDRATANWLLNLARHQGHLVGRSNPRSASLHVLALLEAATEASPDCTEAYYWLYDLYHRMGRSDAARTALAAYATAAPDDEAAAIRLLEIDLDALQTAEARIDHLKAILARPKLPRIFESEAHRLLAKLHYERRDNQAAGKEIEKALQLNAMNVPARELAYEMFGETEPALQRVEMALQMIAINPSQANVVWDLAEFLDRLSLHHQAQEWYNRAILLHKRAKVGPVPAQFWHRLAVSYMSSGDLSKAKEAASNALEADPNLRVARLLRANVLTKLNEEAAAAQDRSVVAEAYRAREAEVERNRDADAAAELAWYYSFDQPDKDRALKFAELAMSGAEPSSLARLAMGYAQRLNGQDAEAEKRLAPLAAEDQMAALQLARIKIDAGEKAAAITLLHKAASLQFSGTAYELIKDVLGKLGETTPAPPLHSKLIAALERFPRDIIDYHDRPNEFLKFSMRFEPDSPEVVGPIGVVLRAENVGPFPITFGEGYMVRPLIAISARLSGAGDASFDNYLQVLLNNRPVLLPGEAVEKHVAIDVGPIREMLLRRVTRPTQIEVTALLDPVQQHGALTVGLGTIKAPPIHARLISFNPNEESVATLKQHAASPHAQSRVAATQWVGALLAELRGGGPRSREADALSEGELDAMLAVLLKDSDWRVRAHALVAAGWTKLSADGTAAAAPAVRDERAVIRLLGVRLFADQQGPKFSKVAEHMSKADPSRFVRMMARSVLPEPAGPEVVGAASPARD